MADSDARTFMELAMASSTSGGCSPMRASRPVTTTSLGDPRYCLTHKAVRPPLRSVPAQQTLFQSPCNAEDHQDYRENQQNQREHQRGVVGALRKGQEIAEALSCRYELSHAGAGEGKTDRDLEIAEHPGRDRRQIDVPNERPAVAAQRDDALDQPAVHLPDSSEH